jgi:periplasmic protein TonB
MEAKKNPSKDIHKKSGMFFLIGLSVSISMVICAFEWTTLKVETKPRFVADDKILVTIDPTVYITESTAPAPQKNVIKKIAIPEAIVETNASEPEPEKQVIEVEPVFSPFNGAIEIPEPEDENLPVVFPEKMPEPIGGYGAFYNFLSDKMRYPSKAVQAGIQGRVFIEFVVNKKGEPQNAKVLKGIGYGCDDEALRIIALTKWEPGKQRGKPVIVKMVLPIQFKLQ